jgi:hypothetical protein
MNLLFHERLANVRRVINLSYIHAILLEHMVKLLVNTQKHAIHLIGISPKPS